MRWYMLQKRDGHQGSILKEKLEHWHNGLTEKGADWESIGI